MQLAEARQVLSRYYVRNRRTLRKAMDKSHLVQIPVQFTNEDGTTVTRMQWVDPNSDEAKEYFRKKEDQKPQKQKKPEEQKKVRSAKKDEQKAKRKADDAGGSPAAEKPKKPVHEKTPIDSPRLYPDMKLVESAKDVPDWITEQTGRIPPAWRMIQIATDKDADRLVCGYDDKARMQTKYSKAHEQRQAEIKFQRVRLLQENREKLAAGIAGIDDADVRDCLQLIMATGLRPGSVQSAKDGHYGATTLLAEHIAIEKTRVYLRFIGKEGVIHNHEVKDPALRRMLRARKRKAEKTADKRIFNTSPDKLNKQLKAVTECIDISVKDLRTMRACDAAFEILSKVRPVKTAAKFAELRNRVGEEVCAILGNGRDMALSSYIDAAIFMSHSPEGYDNWIREREEAKSKPKEPVKKKPRAKRKTTAKKPVARKKKAEAES